MNKNTAPKTWEELYAQREAAVAELKLTAGDVIEYTEEHTMRANHGRNTRNFVVEIVEINGTSIKGINPKTGKARNVDLKYVIGYAVASRAKVAA